MPLLNICGITRNNQVV
jgi:hypothetical protein